MKYILGFIILVAFISCGKNDNENESIFEFNLNNSFRIESTGMVFETSNALQPQNIPQFNVFLTDSEVGNELTQSCCGSPWDYIINPSTHVLISFTKNKSELSSGIYTYDRNAEENDFVISISNQMIFDPNNNLISLNSVANSYSSNSEIKIDKNSIKIMSSKRPEPYDIVTETHPGFPTDLQAQYMALMSISNGNALIKENIFENRFMHVPELLRMGANITINNQTASIIGVKELKGSKVMASDLRASMSLILGALAAVGSSEIDGIYHLDRGYEKIEDKLSNLGAIIRRSK